MLLSWGGANRCTQTAINTDAGEAEAGVHYVKSVSKKNHQLYYCRGVEQRAVRRRRSNIEAGEADADVHYETSVSKKNHQLYYCRGVEQFGSSLGS